MNFNNKEDLQVVDVVSFNEVFPNVKSLTKEELEKLSREFYTQEISDFKGQVKVLKFSK